MPEILIVEDDKAMTVALSDGFQYEGYSVKLARDGAEGLALASERKFDIIILDVMLPLMSGFDICKQLRSAGNRVPVIVRDISSEGCRLETEQMEVDATVPSRWRRLLANLGRSDDWLEPA